MPLFSFMLSKGKCRYCKKKISVFYPTLETCMGVMFLITSLLMGFADIKALIFFLLVTFVFVTISFYDFLFKEIPDEIALPAFVISFLYIWLSGAHSITNLSLGVGIPVAFFGTLFLASRGKWLGGGDIRIGALMGALLGWPLILIGLFLGYFTGAIYSLIGLATKKFSRKSQIPFAPFLLLGTYIAIFWGQKILDWYLGKIG
jgi:leader peptidase (prepilin peptidase)/N-methyltransferase